MSSNNASGKTVSDVQSTTTEEREDEPTVEHEPAGRSACPECEGQVITEDEQSFCTDCGLVVADEWVDLSPTLNDLGLVGDADQSIETVDPLRTDKGLHTKIGRNTDGRGNPLSNEQWEKVQRLRKWHKRMQFGEKRKRTKRLNEGLRDVEMISGNLGLPDHVSKQAAQYLRSASEARLPGGRMAWEALAGGAVLLAATEAGFPRSCDDVVQYTKSSYERVSAAARKLRCELDLDVPPARDGVVDDVLIALDDILDVQTCLELRELSDHLLAIADEKPVGPGTSRLTMGAAAVYVADRLTDGKVVTQAQVADAASTVVDTSKSRISRYSQTLHDAYEAKHGCDDPDAVLERGRIRLQ
ncbi:transcription initiation factor IIB [Halarchaeum nitratireducens]|uniref:Transcription initiation factor IIB 2 n=1 Tax=Halarchaeum nitratireducens TaxID=489913 RepID=A0A830GHE4_9EURY|nr:transcription initiation factor IIB family protein [Halarchaeum nitratireducens]GGN26387.1 transcription initiation factor IIB 2 [Halarchaeum nitratireducens]